MRFSSLAVFGLVSTAFALPAASSEDLAERQLPGTSDTTVVDKAIAAIQAGTQKLDKVIKTINSDDLNALLPLDGDAQALNKIIIAQTKKVKAAPAIALFSALGVQGKVSDLIKTVQTTLGDLKKIKKYTDSASVSSLVVTDLQTLAASSAKFGAVLKTKVPSIAGFLADYDNKQIADAFADAIKYFQQPASSS